MSDQQTSSRLITSIFHKENRNILLTLIVTIVFAITIEFGIAHISSNKVELQHFNELRLVATLKVRQIERWLTEHKKGISLVISSHTISSWLTAPDRAKKEAFDKRLEAIRKNFGFKSILIEDISRNVVVNQDADEQINSHLQMTIDKAFDTGKLQYTDLYRYQTKAGEHVHFDFVAPVEDNSNFVVIMRVDKDEFLFPFLQEWPVPSESAETLLFKKESDGVLLLNELRHEIDTALKRKILFNQKNVLAIQVASNEVEAEQFITGTDYRGVPVIGVSIYIPELQWFLIAKIDKSEVYNDLRGMIFWQILMLILFLSSIIAAALIFIQKKRLHLSALKERDLAEGSLDKIFQVMPDLYFRMSLDGTIIDYRAQESSDLYESPDVFIGKRMQDVLPDEQGQDFQRYIKQVIETKKMITYEYQLNISDSYHWFEARLSLSNNASHLIAIVRNITEQKQSHEALIQANMVVESSPVVLFRWKAADGWPVELASSNVSQFGYTSEELLSGIVPYASIIHPDDLQRVVEEVSRFSQSGVNVFHQEYRIVSPDGTIHWTDDRTQIIRDPSGKVTHFQGTVIDVSDRKMLEERASDFNRLFESSLNEIYIFDSDSLIFLDVNYAAQDNLGYSLEALKDMTPVDIKPEFCTKTFNELLNPLRQNIQRKLVFTSHHQRKDGSSYPIEAHVQLTNREPLSFIALIIDITDREQAEKSLRESERKLSSITESVNDAIIMSNEKGIVTFWNHAAEKMFGYLSDEANGKPIDELIIPEDKRGAHNYSYSVFSQSGKGVLIDNTIELIALHKDRHEIDIELSLSSFKLAGNWQAVGIVRDIGLRKMMEQKILKLAQAVEQSSGSIVITDLEGKIEYVNESFLAITGYTYDEALGQNPRILNSGKTPSETYVDMWETLAKGLTWKGEFHNKRKDGSEYVEFAIVTPLRQRDGTITHYVAVKEDITEKKKIGIELDKHRNHLENLIQTRTIELHNALEVADKASQAKSEFLANMSHEIRTPMNAIIGLIHLLRRDEVKPKHLTQLNKIDSAANHLLAIINDILDISKIEAGKLKLEKSNFHLSTVFDHINSLQKDQAMAKGLKLEFINDDVPAWLYADVTRVQQSLLNFLSNAIKFSENSVIHIRVKKLHEKTKKVYLQFEVEDEGIGIKPESVKQVFDAFEQGDASTTRKFGGTGLGLAITRKLVELMDGEIGVESELGKGSRFWFTTWMQKGNEPKLVSSEAHITDSERLLTLKYTGSRILLVEDNEINREVAEALLTNTGLIVEAAVNGKQAVDKVKKGHYDLVLMDIQMPVMDGIESTELIRLMKSQSALPILAMTANVFEDDRKACLDVGMNGFVSKPVNPHDLFTTLLEWLPKPEGSDNKISPDMPITAHNRMSVLTSDTDIVELSMINGLNTNFGLRNCMGNVDVYISLLKKFDKLQVNDISLICELLNEEQYKEAIYKIHSLKGVAGNLGLETIFHQAKILELTLRDNDLVNLSKKTEQLTNGLKQFNNEFHAITLSNKDGDIRSQSKEELKLVLKSLTELLETDDATANEYFESFEKELRKAFGDSIDKLKYLIENFDYLDALAIINALDVEGLSTDNVINLTVLDNMFGEGSEKSLRFLRKFVPQAENLISQIEASFDEDNLEQIGFDAHKLKSSSRAIGAEQLGIIFESLEFSAKAGDKPKVKKLLGDIQSEMTKVKTYIEGIN